MCTSLRGGCRSIADSFCSAALKVAEVDLASARSHVQQFQEISQANEEALANLSATHDEYKAATDADLTRRQVCSTHFLFS